MNYEKAYKEALNKLQEALSPTDSHEISGLTRRCIEEIFPELKETEEERDKRMWKLIKKYAHFNISDMVLDADHITRDQLESWLEKQGEQNGSAKEAPASCALSFINYLDAHRYEGKMCVSNGECEDIADAFHNGMWDKLHRYYCKYIEKQGEQKPVPQWMVEFLDEDCRRNLGKTLDRDVYREMEGKLIAIKGFLENPQRVSASEVPKKEKIDDNADKVKPEFQEGDWIVFGDTVGQISGIQEDCYIGRDIYGWYFALSRPEGNSNTHLWTIEDAKSGDVLSWDDNKCIALFKNIDDEESFISYGCVGHCTGVFESRESYHDIEDVHPATKEQRDTLFQKMKEAGYEKMEQKPQRIISAEAKEAPFNYTNILSVEEQTTLENLINKLAVSGIQQYNTQAATILFKNWHSLNNYETNKT